MDSMEIIGILGAGIILVLFLLNQSERIQTDSLLYDSGNFLGSSLLVAYSLSLSAYPFAVLNAVWALFSLRDMLRGSHKKRLK